MTPSTKAHANLLAAAVAVAQAKAKMNATPAIGQERSRAVDALFKREWALSSAAVAFARTAMGREIAATVKVSDKDGANQ